MRISLLEESNPVLNTIDIPHQYTNVDVPGRRFTIVVDMANIFNFNSPPSDEYKMKIICGSGVNKLKQAVIFCKNRLTIEA